MTEARKLVPVLDKGFVELVDSMGTDLTVVNSARVSFGKRKDSLDESDIRLIHYLAEHHHYSPFRHVQFQFHCKVPEFVARQWYKHVVGISYSEAATVDHAWNEISMRYVEGDQFEFYIPEYWRGQSDSNKQASAGFLFPELSQDCYHDLKDHVHRAQELYRACRERGAAKEMCRMFFPLNIYTEFYWTVSLQALANFLKLRTHPGAQSEIMEYARVLGNLASTVTPYSLSALIVPGAPVSVDKTLVN